MPMRRRLAIFGVLGALLLWWPSVAHEQQTPTNHKNENSQSASATVPPTHVVIDKLPPIEHDSSKPGNGENATDHNALPAWSGPEWVIVYVTAAYVLIAGFTLAAIWRQG